MKRIILVIIVLSTFKTLYAQNDGVNWRDSIAVLLMNYMSCETWESASQYVMEPEKVKVLMEKQYQNTGFESRYRSVDEIKHDMVTSKIKGNYHVIYRCVYPENKDTYYIVKTVDGYKIDWEATVGWSSATPNGISNAPNKDFEIRTNLLLREPIKSNDNWRMYDFLYVKKNSPIDKQLFKILSDGKRKGMVIKVKYVTTDATDYDTSNPCNYSMNRTNPYFTITEVVSANLSKY